MRAMREYYGKEANAGGNLLFDSYDDALRLWLCGKMVKDKRYKHKYDDKDGNEGERNGCLYVRLLDEEAPGGGGGRAVQV